MASTSPIVLLLSLAVLAVYGYSAYYMLFNRKYLLTTHMTTTTTRDSVQHSQFN